VPGEVELVSKKAADRIKSPADFKGANLGVTGLGSSTNFLTQYLAVKNGVPIDQIHSVAVGAGDTFIAAMNQGTIDAGMTTEPTISRMLKTGDAKVLVEMRTAEGTRAALGGTYPAACVYAQVDWVNKNKDTVQKLANAFVKTLKWINTHSAAEITDKMPQDYWVGDKELYVKALEAGKGMYTPDGVMPPDGPETVLKVLSAFDKNVQGKQIDLKATYTTEFVTVAK
jgi:NitT/TauT family transport system substrate-binding protein